MAKNPNKKVSPKDEPMNGAMKFFLASCVAELYLLILRRFYINADSELTRIAWYDHYLWTLAGIGAGVLAVGVIAALVLRSSAKKQKSAWILAAAGAFVGAATALVRWNMATLSFMTIVVPVIMLLVPMLIPLSPGGDLYYMMSFLVRGQYEAFGQYAQRVLTEAGAIALGIICVASLMNIIAGLRVRARGGK